MGKFIFNEEQREFIKVNVEGRTVKELTDLFNKTFNTSFKISQIRNFKKNHKLKSGVNAKFTKGNIPYNKGTKGVSKANKTCYKKGHVPHNALQIGAEVLRADGYTYVKVAEPNIWEFKHRLIYEKYKGKIPKGYKVVFADKNKRNFNIDNLILVTTKELLTMNAHHLIQDNSEFTKSGLIVADILIKIKECKKGD